jgi:hypothetical protein
MFAAMVALVIQTKYPTQNWTILNLNIRKIIMDSVYILSNNRDITSGSNGFNASVGFDLVTGMGSPLFNNLSQYILNNFTKLSGLKKAGALGAVGMGGREIYRRLTQEPPAK